jgi:hypothetical protein
MTTAGYEFTAAQNEIFRGLVRNMKKSGAVVAIASLILLAHTLVEHFEISLGGKPSEAVYYIDVTAWCLMAAVGVGIAFLVIRATGAFTAVIHTEGNDVEHLMQGLAKLRDILNLLFWAAALGSILVATSFVLLIGFS